MAIIFKDKKKRKVDHDHNYGGFWLDKSMTDIEYSGRTNASSVVKALKLANYQKAIGNFVKILAQRDIPVRVKGTESYTDGETQVVIAGNVNDKNFDITAGLALHEASHLKYTDFKVLKSYMKGVSFDDTHKMRVKNMLNWIEDRRIDTLVFKSCPGYKAYYHKLYDHYFRCKDVTKMLKGKQFREETYENYEAHIINMMNTAFDKNALDVLPQVTALINVNKISRLNNTAETLALAEEVVKLIEAHLESLAQQHQDQDSDDQQEQEEQQTPGQGENEEAQEDDDKEDGNDEESENCQGSGAGGGGQESDDEEEEAPELSAPEMAKIMNKLEEQKEMMDGKVQKKTAAKSIASKMKNLQDTETDFSSVGEGRYKGDCIIYRLDREPTKVAQYYNYKCLDREAFNLPTYEERNKVRREYVDKMSAIRETLPAGLSSNYRNEWYTPEITKGLQVGAILGRKLQTRRESRELVTNRLRTGRIDNKRLAHAGYGIENVFNQIHIDKYKKANIHLTIDASGSMGGDRWRNSIQMGMALGKAVSMIEGIELQVSMRETDHGDQPVVTQIYDSRVNKLIHLRMLLEIYQPNSMTPEGLCLEAMIKKNMFVPSNTEMDSYMINICDGAPGAGSYGGYAAVMHTRKQVKRINNELGIKHVGFFFGRGGMGRFTDMYGVKESKQIEDANNAVQIAQHMNKELMSK